MKISWMTGVIYATELSVLILPSTPIVAAVFEHAVGKQTVIARNLLPSTIAGAGDGAERIS
jgi:hypothetical protein